MSTIHLEGLRTPAFRNANATVSEGLTVALTYRDDAARAFTTILGGLDKPLQGRVLVDGHSLGPNERRRFSVLLPAERFDFAPTVGEAIAFVQHLWGTPGHVESVLQPLGIAGLTSRRTHSLTARESRQVSLALAMAHTNAIAVVLYEPLLALDAAQVAPFQQWVAQTSTRACVVCITTSPHDARVLGGPHAQLTAYGWEPLGVGARGAATEVIALEGSHARRLASEIALSWPVSELVLSLGDATDTLRVTGGPRDVTTRKLIQAARANGVSISRLRTEVIETTDTWSASPWVPGHSSPVTTLTRPSLSTLATVHAELRASARSAKGTAWMLLIILPSALALGYAVTLRARHTTWDRYESQVFIGTILTPLCSLGVAHFFARRRNQSSPSGIGRHGVNRRWLALVRTAFAAAIVACASAAASVCATTYLLSWRAMPPALVELYQYTWIMALGGAVYGAIAMYLSHFKRRWLLSWAFILLDALLGGLNRSVACAFPRAHIHNLLGSPSSIDISQPASCAILGATLALAIGLIFAKTAP